MQEGLFITLDHSQKLAAKDLGLPIRIGRGYLGPCCSATVVASLGSYRLLIFP
jgi:hypothetical protein